MRRPPCRHPGGRDQTRPESLAGIAGVQAGTRPGFAYPPAMRGAAFRWDGARLARFLERPGAVVPGARMVFSRVPDRGRRRDLIA